jgi:hypothetical protein
LTIETSKNVNAGLPKRQDDSEKLLRGLIELSVGFEVEVNIDKVSSSEELKK